MSQPRAEVEIPEGDEPSPAAADPGRRRRLEVVPAVFFTTALAIIALVSFSVFAREQAAALFHGVEQAIVERMGWLFLASVLGFLGFSIVLLFTPFARIRLGDDDERPEFSYLSWFAMLFSAGMGIGLLFFSVAEPLFHYQSPPSGEPLSPAAASTAMGATYFHWGLHAWAVYVVIGLALAYYGYRLKLPLAVRSTLYPLIGRRIHGWPGHLVDILAVFGTVFGLATSLGLGAMQINAGLDVVFHSGRSLNLQLVIIAVVTGAATISLVSGVNKGIKLLSELNLVLAAALLLFVLFAGPTSHVLASFPRNLGAYAAHVGANLTFSEGLGDDEFQASWTVFYWAWWISWAPFVGTFVARISRGRTVREFILGVLLVPTAVTFVWLTVFGESALHTQVTRGGLTQAVNESTATAIYALLANFPLAGATQVLALVVVATFFVTSSDSGSFVVDILTSGGHPNPPIWQRIFWALTEGAVASVLLVAGASTGDPRGGLRALQSAAISTGLPFCVVMLVMCVGLVVAFRRDGARNGSTSAGGNRSDGA